MSVRFILQAIVDQFVTLGDAPFALLVAIALTAAAAWGVTKWRYEARLARLRKSNERKDSMIALLKGAAPAPVEIASASAVEDEPLTPASDVHARRRALRRIVNAIDAAQFAAQSNDPRAVDNAMASMGLALLAARNVFDLPAPGPTGAAAADLDVGRRFLELVRPALLLGRDDEARRSAAAFLRRAAAA